MREAVKTVAQGDMLLVRVESVPDGYSERPPTDGQHLVAHSETGHHHTVSAEGVKMLVNPQDPMVCYLSVAAPFVDLEHHRTYDTHETLRLPQGTWKVYRQREYTPEGWRRVED